MTITEPHRLRAFSISVHSKGHKTLHTTLGRRNSSRWFCHRIVAVVALLVSKLANNGVKYQMYMCLDSNVVQSEFPVEVKGCILIERLSGLKSWRVDLSTPPWGQAFLPPLMGQKRVTARTCAHIGVVSEWAKNVERWSQIVFVMDHTVLRISSKMGIFLILFFKSLTVTVKFQCYSTNLPLKIGYFYILVPLICDSAHTESLLFDRLILIYVVMFVLMIDAAQWFAEAMTPRMCTWVHKWVCQEHTTVDASQNGWMSLL